MQLFCAVRYFLHIAYKGSNYSGWQVQDNANTVQAEINQSLSTLLKVETACMGSGRTDSGVHALGQVAHFDTEDSIDIPDFIYKLNSLLPVDISIRDLKKVRDDAHARFDATSRSYKYFIHIKKEPFISQSSYFFSSELNLACIHEAIEIIRNWKDFEAFSKVHTEVNHFKCDIFDARWELNEQGFVFYIRANRFLRGMVRAIVGTLLDIGQEKTSVGELTEILKNKNRRAAGRSVSADGLYLHAIEYPNEIYL